MAVSLTILIMTSVYGSYKLGQAFADLLFIDGSKE